MTEKQTPEELSKRYLAQIERIYGKAKAEKSICVYEKGWFYVNVARENKDGSIGNSRFDDMSVRRSELEKMIERLERINA